MKNVPILIISFNNPTYTTMMVNQLLHMGCTNIIIYDNMSSSNGMLECLNGLSVINGVKVQRLEKNYGPRVFTRDEIFVSLPDIFVVTDPDLEFNNDLPYSFLDDLLEATERYKVGKAGFAISIDDRIKMRNDPFDINGKKLKIWEWEEQFWANKVGYLGFDNPVYGAEIDTTFALYNKKYFDRDDFYKAVRVGGCFACRHLPWYTTELPPKEELLAYLKTERYSTYLNGGIPLSKKINILIRSVTDTGNAIKLYSSIRRNGLKDSFYKIRRHLVYLINREK
jgi:hypothetical protein